tara:strand:- start:1033 stop:1806 length:774 start_codon:yes stop_codon:yes gene_type:complete
MGDILYKKMNDFLNLKNKTILITGASSGLGFATGVLLDSFGANLVLHSSKEENIRKLKKAFKSKRHLFFQADFSNPVDIENNFKKTLLEIKFDGYINCVGIRSRRPINLIKPSHTIHILNTNFTSFLEMVRIITKKNQFNSGLSIVSISSISSIVGGMGVTAYAASKAAIDAAIRCLAKELHKKSIRINSILSGQINTESYKKYMDINVDKKDQVLYRQYLGLGEVDDVANVILFLLSDKSKFITGSSVPVDGGFLS